MNDKELLELAAKAAGYDINFECPVGMIDYYAHGYDEDGDVEAWWNPLHNDGDALRLAAKLKIDIEWQSTQVGARPDVEAYISDPDGSCFCASEAEADYRRAIVCAAANLGESMQ